MDRAIYPLIFLLSAAGLLFEVNQTRLFAVAQFYHFAFMMISMALLGYGVSGTWLALSPSWGKGEPLKRSAWLSLASGLGMLSSYLLSNWLPFDSFSIAWDLRQAVILCLHLIALASPFFFTGLVIGTLLEQFPDAAGKTYSFNLAGSAIGCLLALVLPSWLGGEGVVVCSAMLSALAGVFALVRLRRHSFTFIFLLGLLFALTVPDIALRLTGGEGWTLYQLHLSPYKGLSYALRMPNAQTIYRRWNSFSRVDVIRSPSIRSLPGLSIQYRQAPPPQDGLLVDGDDLSGIVRKGNDLSFVPYLPSAVVYALRPGAEVLVLEGRGGLDVVAAQALGAGQVTVVEANPLIIEAAKEVYLAPGVEVAVETERSYLRRTEQLFDVVVLTLTSSYHPVRSGAYSLAEDYRYTIEAFEDMLRVLKTDGLLVVARWEQSPPSESLRAFALAVTALERSGLEPYSRLAMWRGYNLSTLLVKKTPFEPWELEQIRRFTQEKWFDLSYLPGLAREETNIYNILPDAVDYEACQALLDTQRRAAFLAEYPFDITPPSDDRPFFGHFFKWSQVRALWAEMGKTWQPFGGAGYFVILIILAFVLLLTGLWIVLPMLIRRSPHLSLGSTERLPILLYFGLLGLAFLLVEIPLIQRFMLYLGHPAYSVSVVLFSLLFFSGLGSRWGYRVDTRLVFLFLVCSLLSLPWILPKLFALTLKWNLWARLLMSGVVMAPLGLCMGVPFPAGIRHLTSISQGTLLIPWAWGINGSASVVSAVLAALLALSFGFRWVLWCSALCYALAGGMYALSGIYRRPNTGALTSERDE
jgi:SAM-dependent methyltransferase